MAAQRPPDEILKSFIANRGKEARLRRKLTANRQQNWLLALTLHSFAKATENAALTDLEQSLVEPFRHRGFSDMNIRALGNGYRELPESVRHELFPEKFGALTPTTSYSFADLKSDAPTLTSRFLSAPNVSDVDVHALHTGVTRPRDAMNLSTAVLHQFGSSHIRVVSPNTRPPNPTFTIKATWFRCLQETDEWSSEDEVYWLFGMQAPGLPKGVSSNSHIYEHVNAGQAFQFEAEEGCIWGESCLKQDLPGGEVASIVQLIEHDAGNVDEIVTGWNSAVAGVSGILAAAGVTAWVAAVVAALGGIIGWIIGMQDDDPIAHETFTFTRQVIDNQLGKKPVMGHFDITRLFTDGDAEYRLRMRISRF
jgi:hypothetical protein